MTHRAEIHALAGPVTLVGIFLILVPLVNVAPEIWPVELAARAWRFGSLGMVFSAGMFPTVGLACLLWAGVLRESAKWVRLAARVSGLLALMGVVGLVLFGLDGAALASVAGENMSGAFWAAIVRTIGIGVLVVPVLAGLCVAGLRTARAMGLETTRASGLVVGS